MDTLIEQLKKQKVLPVLQFVDAESVLPVAEILVEYGFPMMEITLRSDIAYTAIKDIKRQFANASLSAGTVLKPDHVDAAAEAGAEFLISPGFNPVTFRYAVEKNVPMVPGINSPSDIEQAMEEGAQVLKFFPAEASGGVKMIKSLLGPYQNIQLIPTGGIKQDNVMDYLAIPQIIACGGTWLADAEDQKNKDWDSVRQKCKALRELLDSGC